MKCDQCDNEATVHDLSICNGVKIERHLCEGCAAQHGLTQKAGSPISEILKAVVGVPMAGAGVAARVTACPQCATTFAEFKQHGLLGCPTCYEVFAAQLGPLLERAHDGAVRHMGKMPKRGTGRGGAVPTLRRELDAAVQSEQYELAAKLRDEIRRLQEANQSPNQP
jgi:protein arginine kinase activator